MSGTARQRRGSCVPRSGTVSRGTRRISMPPWRPRSAGSLTRSRTVSPCRATFPPRRPSVSCVASRTLACSFPWPCGGDGRGAGWSDAAVAGVSCPRRRLSTRRLAAEPCPASDAEPPLHCPVLLPILRRTPDKQHTNENERYEQHQEHDHNEGDIHTVVLPEAPRFYSGGELQALENGAGASYEPTRARARADQRAST